MQTMQQLRAKSALQAVQAALAGEHGQDQDFQKAFKAYVSEMPAMIHMNGLGQAAAFFRGKANGQDAKARAREQVYQLLSHWLCGTGAGHQEVPCQHQPYHGQPDLLAGITSEDANTYRLAQAEAMAYMDWVKKFSAAYIQID